MPLDLLAIYQQLPVFLLVAGRIGGIVMFLPAVGGMAVPPQVRALATIGLAAVAAPLASPPAAPPEGLGGLALGLGGEVLMGVLIGLVVRACFLGLEMGGLLIAQESGLAYGAIADPSSGQDQSILSVLYAQLGLVLFIAVGGHRTVLGATLDSFGSVPLLAAQTIVSGGGDVLIDALATGGVVAVRVAAPVVITLFLMNLAMGFVSRTVPQLNITTLGFSLKGLLAFAMIAASLPAAGEAFADGLDEVLGWVGEMLGARHG